MYFSSFQALLHFPKYCEPITAGDAQLTDSRKLWRNIEPHLKKALHTVYLREVSSNQWENIIGQDTETDNEYPGGQGKNCATRCSYNNIVLLIYLVKLEVL